MLRVHFQTSNLLAQKKKWLVSLKTNGNQNIQFQNIIDLQ